MTIRLLVSNKNYSLISLKFVGKTLDFELALLFVNCIQRKTPTPIGLSTVIGIGRGILLKHERSNLNEFGRPISLNKDWAIPRSLMATIRSCKVKSNLAPNKGGLPHFLPSNLLTIAAIPGSVDFCLSLRASSYAFFQSRTVLSFNFFSLK